MRLNWKTGKRERTVWGACFFAGFLGGIAAVCLLPEALVIRPGFLDARSLSGLRYLEINRSALFLYSLRQRLGTAALLVLLAAAGLSRAGSGLFLFWGGLSAGTVLTALSMRLGIRGLLVFLGCALPQQLLLVPAYLLLLDRCAGKREKRSLLLPFIGLILGCLLEGYVNPFLLKAALLLL